MLRPHQGVPRVEPTAHSLDGRGALQLSSTDLYRQLDDWVKVGASSTAGTRAVFGLERGHKHLRQLRRYMRLGAKSADLCKQLGV